MPPASADCPEPLLTAISAGEPITFVRENDLDPAPDAEAATVKVPVVELALSSDDVAIPWESVDTTHPSDGFPPGHEPNVTLAPDAGAVKVTGTPDIGLPNPSATFTSSPMAYWLSTAAL